MAIDPTGLNQTLDASQFASAEFPGAAEAAFTPNEIRRPESPDFFADMEQRFGDMVEGLRSQLAALEKRLTSALREFMAHYRTAAQPSSTGGTGPSRTMASAYDGVIKRAAQRHELDPALLSAVVQRESNFDARAVSKAGAQGLMQLMPDTAKELGVRDAFDPEQNIEGGATYLRGLIDRYHGRLDLALAAYNAGSGAVDQYGGVPPYAETKAYVQGILGSYRASALSG